MGKRELSEEVESGERISYTQYSAFMTCPKQWKAKYVDKLKDKSIELVFGSAMHYAIQEWLVKHFNEPAPVVKLYDVVEVFKLKFMELFQEETIIKDGVKVTLCDQKTFAEYFLDGREILLHLRKYKEDFFPTAGYELLGIELPLNVMTTKPDVKYIGYLDIVIRNKKTKEIIIIDLKTSRAGWTYQKKDELKINQLLLYKKFYSEIYDVPLDQIIVQFIILKRKISENTEWDIKRLSKFEPAHGKISMKRVETSFNKFLDSLFNPDGTKNLEGIKATPSKTACKYCPIKSTCVESYYLDRK